jgi:3'(2'),5'-bisphosphate nucleotidase
VAPDVPVVAEEAVSAGKLPAVGNEFFLVDPLDGTKEFVKGGDDFTVNIGLIRHGVPVLGIVLAPATGDLYVGVEGEGAWKAKVAGGKPGARQPVAVRPDPKGPILVVASKSHRTPETDDFIFRFDVGDLVSAGSSLKFCLVAEGAADLYPRMGTTMQWDTAAGDAVVRAAGGTVVTMDGKSLRYGPNGAEGAAAFQNPWFVAAGGLPPLP